jgi:hypothetical protein
VIRFPAALALAVPLAAVAAGPVAPPPREVTHYFPTSVGARWVCQEGDDTPETFIVTGVENKDGVWVVAVARMKADGTVAPEEKLEVSGKGVFRVEYLGIAVASPVCLLRLPARPGDTWECKLVSRTRVSRTVRGVEKVEVPAGTFEAVVVDSEVTYGDGSTARATSWYAPGVGRVKQSYGGPVARTEVMKSFTPGKD